MNTRSLFVVAGIVGVLSFNANQALANLEVSASVSIHASADFYEPLAPCGAWVDVGTYGRCWHPTGVAVGWRPYCEGYWEWTDCGWYWESDEPWAWACYHYGTWVIDPTYGWVWVPDVEWAPAWVYWRYGGDYVGWAPCPPHRTFFSATVRPSAYVFVQAGHICDPVRVGAVIVNNDRIFAGTTEVTRMSRENRTFDGNVTHKVVINNGPGIAFAQKATGRTFTPIAIRDADRRTVLPEKFRHDNNKVNETVRPAPNQPHEPMRPEPDKKVIPDNPHRPPPVDVTPDNKDRRDHQPPPPPVAPAPPVHVPGGPPVPVLPPEGRQSHDNGHGPQGDHGDQGNHGDRGDRGDNGDHGGGQGDHGDNGGGHGHDR